MRHLGPWLCVMALIAVGAGCQSAQRINLPANAAFIDLNGHIHQPLDNDSPATVLIFITNDCPIANTYAPEINHIVREYSPQGVSFYLVHVDRGLADADAQQHAADYGYTCPVLRDPNLELARGVGATVTPEAAVIYQNQRLVYRGRIDDRYIDFGKKRFAPTTRDLRNALDESLSHRTVKNPRTHAIGCYIPG